MDQPPPSQLRSTLQGLVIVLASAIISNVCATALVIAWTGPSSFPPAGNVAAPINVSSTNQVKNANLAVNGLSVFGNSLLNPGAYLNWGTTAGSGGYGMRDAGGILEFKTATGTWQSIQAIITSVTASSSNSWSSGPGGSIYYSAGNVGVGTSSAPPAILSVAGAMRLSPRTSAPITCNASYIGTIAVSDSTSHLCVCNGTAWVFDYSGAACTWSTAPDTTPPTVTITNPTSGTYVRDTVSVTATASDNVGVVGVQIKLDGVNLNAEDTTAPYSTAWDASAAQSDSISTHTFTAIARDAAGNQSTSAPVTVYAEY